MGVVIVLVLSLWQYGSERNASEAKAKTLETAFLKLENQADNLEAGIKDCLKGTRLRVQFPKSSDFADVDCKLVNTNVWDYNKKKKATK